MQPFRLPEGGRIDRSKSLDFTFNGRRLQGFAGDSLASALLANGELLVGRSFKYHRPRSIVGSGAEEPNAILQLGRGAAAIPNQRATQVELHAGLEAAATRGWPSPDRDLLSVAGLAHRVLAAGFYYKTFMFPRRLWGLYEHVIRLGAGWGVTPHGPDPDTYDHRNAHCDVLIAGGGPAGLMAALAAGRAGASVVLADEQTEPGGSLLFETGRIGTQYAGEWLAGVLDDLAGLENVTLLPRATVFGYHDHNFLTVAERLAGGTGARERLWRIRARQVVLAQGAFERPLVFCNNDRPGIMLASAVACYINRYAVCPGRRAVVFTNNDSAYRTAIDLARAGAEVEAIIDSRPGGGGALRVAAQAAGISVLEGHVVCDVDGARQLRGVRVARRQGDPGQNVRDTIRIDCDLLAMSGGWSPAVHLHSQAGGTNVWDEESLCFRPGAAVQAHRSAGSGAGSWSLGDCLAGGAAAGAGAAEDCGFTTDAQAIPECEAPRENPIEALWRVPAIADPDRCPRQFLDYQNDTCVADVRLAVREGYRNVEHVKRYTALGFGTDQGRLGNINGMAVLAECLQRPLPEVGTTTFRPAYTPVSFGICAGADVGALHDPERETAIHSWHRQAGAPFEVVGQWQRPWYFPQGEEGLHEAVARECLAVRNAVGIMDASTLGKIDVSGPDAVAFLQRIYTHDIARMKAGKCAYGIMLGEDGMLMDDGVMARLDEQRFYLTTTTGGAAQVLSWLEKWLQTEWPDLRVHLTSLTDHYSTIAVAGPRSREVLQAAGCSIDLDRAAFPFMTTRKADLAGLPVRLFRVSFSGELAFEVNVDSRHALQMWECLVQAGEAFGITPYGTESMHVLRAEKGFVIVGQDTDGSVMPLDLGMDWLLAADKDFLGKRSLARPDTARGDRKQLVGLLSTDGQTVVREGAQLVKDPDAAVPVPMCGHVTSSYASAALGHPIALALLESGRARQGERLTAVDSADGCTEVEVVSPVFYDPKGARQNV